MEKKGKNTTAAMVVGVVVVLAIIISGTIWMANTARRDTDEAVRTVSLLYLDELAGRREQVVAANLKNSIETVEIAVGLMTDEDLSDEEHREAYQKQMKALYHLDRFAFVGESGTVYLSTGPVDEIGSYAFDHRVMKEPEISVRTAGDGTKKVVIAVPIPPKRFLDDTLVVCFMEIDMAQMLKGVSLQSGGENTTFCNIYTRDGYPLTDAVLGGLAEEANLLDALKNADFERGYSYEQVVSDYETGTEGVATFRYGDILETLAYVPVEGTDWMLSYLIRDSVISDKIGSITNKILIRSVIQCLLTVLALIVMFIYILRRNRANARLLAEKEAAAAESRVKQEEMERRLALQDELIAQRDRGERQGRLITALSSDYRSVYYLDLDKDEGICYQARTDLDGFDYGEHFPFLESVTAYCNEYVLESYREEFLRFVQPDAIREGLRDNLVISYRYMISLDGEESWEAVKFAGVRHPDDRDDNVVHSVGACFVDVDDETRKTMEQQQTLSDALKTVEQANRAKTVFLSNMSHEIRTPMNAIIGLDSIALNDPDTPKQTREYLEKIGASAEHLLKLINDILDMSRIESGRMVIRDEEFSFAELLETVNTMFSGQCADKGLDYQCRIRGEVDDHYIGDSMKLRQILINILSNAVKFTPEGGTVELSVERTAKYENQSALQFVIRDTGIGMSEDYLPKLFAPFTQEDSSMTSKYGSSGLGMAITKNIVELMNGDIRVDSEKGAGTTFTVTVTLTDAPAGGGGGTAQTVEPEEMAVLVVDDDPVAREHARLVLSKAGIAAELAGSGTEAIEKVRLRHARRDPYNLILVDWKMPEMDGVETARQMRAIVGRETAIIILTAYRWDDVLEEATRAGVDSFIAKPVFAGAALEAYRNAVKRRSEAAGGETEKAELKGRRILIAEDVQVNAEIMILVLKAREMEAELAVNGRIAVEMFEESEPGYYDAILMDMRMPEMDGLEATTLIRAMDRPDAKAIPIIALTANAFDEDVQRSLQAGLNAHLTKPVQPDHLYKTLEELIR